MFAGRSKAAYGQDAHAARGSRGVRDANGARAALGARGSGATGATGAALGATGAALGARGSGATGATGAALGADRTGQAGAALGADRAGQAGAQHEAAPQSVSAKPAGGDAESPAEAKALTENLDVKTARSAIVLSEIIGPPVSKRRRKK